MINNCPHDNKMYLRHVIYPTENPRYEFECINCHLKWEYKWEQLSKRQHEAMNDLCLRYY